MLDAVDRDRLLQLARRALEARVCRQPAPPVECGGGLDLPCGAFVTIRHAGELRGCLGRLERDASVAATVRDLAALVSDSDPRFTAVDVSELADIEIEISLLTMEREVLAIEEIEVGRHGLIVQRGLRRGLLLPQVAIEQGWDRETFLEHTCLKAGLAVDAWRRGARILVFEAVIVAERTGSGVISLEHSRE